MGKKEAGGDNVINLAAAVCCVEKCGKKADKLNFCPEHYMWFKEGLISKKGVRPTDFDKKYQAYMMKKAA
ncbi:MAG: hypothetical protein KF799_11505 [Bdellovibrionales bacterium]|nr:hypothetical protein [Bdellovibrionales bacterium]